MGIVRRRDGRELNDQTTVRGTSSLGRQVHAALPHSIPAAAHSLLPALAQTDEVKNAAASRQLRLKIQTSLGQAPLFSRGCAAGETKAGFHPRPELAAAVDKPTERSNICFGLWLGHGLGGELALAREIGC